MNAARLALDSLERYGEYPAIRFEGSLHTNLDQERLAGRIAAVLLDHGIGPGDRVLVMMPNRPSIFAAFQGVWKIGAVILPVMPQLGPTEVRYLLENSEATAALTAPVVAPVVGEAAAAVETLRHHLVLGETSVSKAEDVSGAVESAVPVQSLVDRADDDLALLLYTSGTTGRPKGVMLSHRNLLWTANSITSMVQMPPQMRILHFLPMAHSYGVLMMCAGFVKGMVATLMVQWNTQEVFENLERFQIQRLSVVPTMLTYMLDFPERDRYDLSHLAWVWSGGAALATEVCAEFERVFKCEVKDGYGLTESTACATAYSDEDSYRPGSCGRAVPGVKVTVMDDDGRLLDAGEWGEVCISGPNLMKGYWHDDDSTAAARRGAWLLSGDVGYLDEDGFLYITDRKKDLIIKGGENISPREIEEALYEHPAISEVAVAPVPHPVYGDDIWAAVVRKPGIEVDEKELRAHTAEFVTKFKLPSRFVFFEALPKNAVGKILKREIRDQFAATQREEGDRA